MTTQASRRKPEAPSYRFQFDVDPGQAKSLDLLMVHCGAATKRELFNNAITLLEWAVGEVQSGRRIASCDRQGGDIEVVRLPSLELAARSASQFRPQEQPSTPVETATSPAKAESSETTPRRSEISVA